MRIIAVGSAVVLMVMATFLAGPEFVERLDSSVYDSLTAIAGPGTGSGRVVIVEIDEKSLNQFGRWPWSRDRVAQLSQAILDQGAAAVALDMMFPEQGSVDDQVLAQAVSGKPVVTGYAMVFAPGTAKPADCPVQPLPLAVVGPVGSSDAAFFHATSAICTVKAISTAPAVSGFLNATPDADGSLRHVPLVVEYNGSYYPSLALEALRVYRHVSRTRVEFDTWGARTLRLDNQAIPLEAKSALRLRFRGKSRHLPYISAADLLSSHSPVTSLRGAVAIVGGSAVGMENPVLTPVSSLFPSVEIQATALDNLLQGDSFRRPGEARFWELAIALLVGVITISGLSRPRFLWGALTGPISVIGLWTGCILILAVKGTLLSPLPATAVVACSLPVLIVLNYFQQKVRADQAQRELTATTLKSMDALRESESRYHRLVENVNDAIVVDDVEGRLVFANRRFREWFGVPEGEASRFILEDFMAPEWKVEMRTRHDSRMRGEAASDHFEFEGIRPDGTRLWIEALVTAVEDGGRIVGSQAALRDVTERKRMEAQYLQAQKMESIGRLAGGVAHDFNNLLTVINGYSGMVLARLDPEHPLRQDIEEIQKAGERATELTQKLLTFSRRQLVRPRSTNLNVLVADVQAMLRRVIGEDIELVTALSPDLGYVNADPGQIHQVLMNLVVNARDAMPHGGKVTIETRNTEEDLAKPCVYLGITDTGTGMSEHIKQHLFEPFFTTKDQGKGTGLGLATVYGIVHQNGGRIEVTSGLGQGTTFHIYLPRIPDGSFEQPRAAAPVESLRGSETVLVVEDQDAVRELARVILESYGYSVLQASNGPDAIHLAAEYPHKIHLLITDIILPVMDGRVLAGELVAVRPETKVLFISGYSEERFKYRTMDDLAYLSKPFTSEVLGRRVREVLAGGDTQSRRAQIP